MDLSVACASSGLRREGGRGGTARPQPLYAVGHHGYYVTTTADVLQTLASVIDSKTMKHVLCYFNNY